MFPSHDTAGRIDVGIIMMQNDDSMEQRASSTNPLRCCGVLSCFNAVANTLGLPGASAPKKRVLVTGFNDWADVQGNIWKLEVNPTGMLIVGAGAPSPPAVTAYTGPLPSFLRENAQDVEWHFLTLPVVWTTSATIDYTQYDIVINMGLNPSSEMKANNVMVENGAYNMRVGEDAVKFNPPTDVNSTTLAKGAVLARPEVSDIVTAVAGMQLPGGFEICVMDARKGNTYICNETNWRGLEAGLAGEVTHNFFIHMPFPTTKGDMAPLTRAVGSTILALVDRC